MTNEVHDSIKTLRYLVTFALNEIADQIHDELGNLNYQAVIDAKEPKNDPRRPPILEARSISVYKLGEHVCTISIFCTDRTTLYCSDLATTGSIIKLDLNTLTKEIIKDIVRGNLSRYLP